MPTGSHSVTDKKYSDHELLAWAAAIIAEQQSQRRTGIVHVHIMQGRIVRAIVEQSELAPGKANKI